MKTKLALASLVAVLSLAAVALAAPMSPLVRPASVGSVTWSGSTSLALDAGGPFNSDAIGVAPSTRVYVQCTIANPPAGVPGSLKLQASADNVVWLDWPNTSTPEDGGAGGYAWALYYSAPLLRVVQSGGDVDGGLLNCNVALSGL